MRGDGGNDHSSEILKTSFCRAKRVWSLQLYRLCRIPFYFSRIADDPSVCGHDQAAESPASINRNKEFTGLGFRITGSSLTTATK
jgi:hypothetical protein